MNAKITVLMATALVVAATAFAQSYSIDWHSIDAGGGTSTGGVFTVNGNIGQPDAGKMSGGNYTMDGGFWGIIAVVQFPGAPLLSIARPTTNGMALFWASPSTGFTLQQNNTGPDTLNWSNVVATPTGNRFYRLFKP